MTEIYMVLVPALVSGLLTLAGCLFLVSAGAWIKLKESLYDSEAYHKYVAEKRAAGAQIDTYAPLQSFAGTVMFAVHLCLLGGALQLVCVALLPLHFLVSWLGMAVALGVLLYVGFALHAAHYQILDWLDWLQENSQK